MKRADRRNDSFDNSNRIPHSRQPEPLSYHELKASLMTVRAQKSELEQRVQAVEQQVGQTQTLYLEEQQKYQTTLVRYQDVQSQYQEVQSQAQTYLSYYNEEKTRSGELLVQYEQAQGDVQHYLTLYNEAQTETQHYITLYNKAQSETQHYLTLYSQAQEELKFERRSKAGIKGWETRRKKENERLKKEIGEMTRLLRDSLARKDEAIDNLEAMAERMDRIQFLVDSVEGESDNNPVNFLQKMARIWQAIKDILAE